MPRLTPVFDTTLHYRRYSTLFNPILLYSTLFEIRRRYWTLLDTTGHYWTLLDSIRHHSALLYTIRHPQHYFHAINRIRPYIICFAIILSSLIIPISSYYQTRQLINRRFHSFLLNGNSACNASIANRKHRNYFPQVSTLVISTHPQVIKHSALAWQVLIDFA